MVLYNNIVPISLLVTLEIVKYVQAIFINSVSKILQFIYLGAQQSSVRGLGKYLKSN